MDSSDVTIAESGLYASRGGTRLSLPPPTPGRVTVHVPANPRGGIGVTTSRRMTMRDFWELAAWRAGCSVDEAKRRARE